MARCYSLHIRNNVNTYTVLRKLSVEVRCWIDGVLRRGGCLVVWETDCEELWEMNERFREWTRCLTEELSPSVVAVNSSIAREEWKWHWQNDRLLGYHFSWPGTTRSCEYLMQATQNNLLWITFLGAIFPITNLNYAPCASTRHLLPNCPPIYLPDHHLHYTKKQSLFILS